MTFDPSRNVWAGSGIALAGLLVTTFPVATHGVSADFLRLHHLLIFGGTAAFTVGIWIALIRSHEIDRE